jgi:pyruvate dehydrogenase E2 component (dihydrolipoamide acetyltransferase)
VKQFLLPDPGEGLVEAEIVSWRVAVGDQVKINDILVEIETAKSIVELPSPYAGRVTELLAPEGQTVEVGKAIITIDDGSTDADSPAAPSANPAAVDQDQPVDGERVANLVGYGPRTGQSKRRTRRPSGAAEEATAAVADAFSTERPVSRRADESIPLSPATSEPIGAPLPEPGPAADSPVPAGGPVLAKPPVRKLAKDLGVDLAALTGTGPGGVITRDDVQSATPPADPVEAAEPGAAVDDAQPARRQAQGAFGDDIRIPIKGVRKATAQAMINSAFTAPHVTEWVTCDVSAMMELVEKIKQRKDFADVRVSPLLIIAKACLLALGRTRSMNATWDEQAQEIVQHGRVNLGIAAATPRGLVVPNIKQAQALTLRELAAAMQQLIMVARDGRTQPADQSGGTFTITNVGVFGIDAGTPILNPGESGILAIGAISRKPWVVGSGTDERIEPRWVTTLAVSFDHRIVDGEQGSQFLADVAGILRDPGTALLF